MSSLSNDKSKLMQLGYVREKAIHAVFLSSLEVVDSSSLSAVWTPERPANAAPTSCALSHSLEMLTSLRHAHTAITRK